MLRKLPIIGVFGSGDPLDGERAELAKRVGAMIAGLGAHLLTGSGYGVMMAAAEGFVAVADRPGFSIGVVPCTPGGPLDQPNRRPGGEPYPNPFVEIAVFTPLPPRVENWRSAPARNHINVFTADAIVALPGGPGTSNELDMAAEYRNERDRPRGERRTVLIGPAGAFSAEHHALFVHATEVAEAERRLRQVLASRGLPVAERIAS